MEPKPTAVALSADSLKRSSTGESEGFSDYDNSASHEDTDGDTDGERLVTNQQVPTSVDNVGSVCSCKEMKLVEQYIFVIDQA